MKRAIKFRVRLVEAGIYWLFVNHAVPEAAHRPE